MYRRVERGRLFLIGQNRSTNERSGMILEVQIQNVGLFVQLCTRIKFSCSKKSRVPKKFI